MNTNIKLLAGLAMVAASSAASASYTYLGSFLLGDGAYWGTNPLCVSGLDMAVSLYGGTTADYAISTVSSNPLDIDFKAWTDSWGIHPPVQSPQGYKLGTFYDEQDGVFGSTTSAFVRDSASAGDTTYTSFIFHTDAVPEPSSVAALGLGALVVLKRRRKG